MLFCPGYQEESSSKNPLAATSGRQIFGKHVYTGLDKLKKKWLHDLGERSTTKRHASAEQHGRSVEPIHSEPVFVNPKYLDDYD